MKITQITHFSQEELLQRLRNVTLLHTEKTKPIYIYQQADISLSHTPVKDIFPSQLYQLEESIQRAEALQNALAEHNLDIFNLNGYLSYTTDQSPDIFTLLPIIIEYQKEADQRIFPLIADGFHRVALAKKQNRETIQTISIRNVREEYPYPGLPNPHGWEDIISVDSVPQKQDKRRWRFPIETAYNYYRNFNSAFENVGKPREDAKK
ncbi:MAG TPA: hypothetical protein VFQ63_00495 [Patescibacteria group bacterium]|nr:hypothetical protein [Patescibacteria group bacterium]